MGLLFEECDARGESMDEVLAAYRRAPSVTRRRIYLETMEKIFPQVGRKVILDDDLEGLLPLLSLQGEVPK